MYIYNSFLSEKLLPRSSILTRLLQYEGFTSKTLRNSKVFELPISKNSDFEITYFDFFKV